MQKVLLVDNNREYRQVMATMVRRVGCEVIQADDVTEAVAKSSIANPDLIMMQLTLPALDRINVAAWLKSNLLSFGIPLIIYTSQNAGSWVSEALSGGVAAVLTKPVSSADVAEVLSKHLRMSRGRPRPIPSPTLFRNHNSRR